MTASVLVEVAMAEFGRVDILINNAGLGVVVPALSTRVAKDFPAV